MWGKTEVASFFLVGLYVGGLLFFRKAHGQLGQRVRGIQISG